MIKGLTKLEYIDYEIDRLTKESDDLKAGHLWGDWENWRAFIMIDILIKEYEKEKIQFEIDALKDSLKAYKKY